MAYITVVTNIETDNDGNADSGDVYAAYFDVPPKPLFNELKHNYPRIKNRVTDVYSGYTLVNFTPVAYVEFYFRGDVDKVADKEELFMFANEYFAKTKPFKTKLFNYNANVKHQVFSFMG